MKQSHFRTYFASVLFIFSTACSGPKVKETPTSVATEYQNDPSSDRPKSDAPKALNPESRNTVELMPVSPVYLQPATGVGAVAALALAGTAIGLSKVFRTAEGRTDLNGTCVYGTPEAPMVSRCINVTVNLLDTKKNIVSSSATNRSGDFRFYIPEQQSYYIQVIDKKGREATTKALVGRSEYVSLYLAP